MNGLHKARFCIILHPNRSGGEVALPDKARHAQGDRHVDR